jgi:hypothetical protein
MTARRRSPGYPVRGSASVGDDRDYYGAVIREATLGPRRELTLRIELWPAGRMTFGGGDLVTLRFGAIVNFAEVQLFFANVPVDSLHYLRYLNKPKSRRQVVEMEFDRTGDSIRIDAGNIG